MLTSKKKGKQSTYKTQHHREKEKTQSIELFEKIRKNELEESSFSSIDSIMGYPTSSVSVLISHFSFYSSWTQPNPLYNKG